MINEKGNLRETPVMAQLLQIFANGDTGILNLKRGQALKVLYFNDGTFTWAFSNCEEDKLENLLQARGLVAIPALESLKRDPQSVSAMGKMLVEKGLITFEQLIETTREQLQQILFSVLDWSEGSYEFNRDNPPNRLVLLNLEIPQFVWLYIQENKGGNAIAAELGLDEGRWRTCRDEQRIEHFQLTAGQQELLARFRERRNAEEVLAEWPENERENKLKIFYLLFQAGLLERQEGGTHEPLLAEHEFSLSDEEPESPPQRAPTMSSPPKSPQAMVRPEAAEEKISFLMDEKKKPRRSPWILLGILVIVAAAAIWLKLNSGSPAPDVSLASSSTPRRPLRKPVQQQPTPAQSQNVQPSQAQGSQVEKAKPVVAQPTETKPGPAVVKQVPVPNQKQPLPATSTAKIQSPAAKPDPLTLFNRGDYEAAGRAWKEELQKAGIRYAIFLELDCRAESLLLAYRQFKEPGDFFILNRQRNGHTCFLVLWGKFANKMAAEAAIPRLPSFFLKQPEQPEVIDLSRNL